MAEEVKKHRGVKLLDFSSDRDHHRSVFTFIGEPEAIKEAAFSLAMKAIDLIDMREHKGGHPVWGQWMWFLLFPFRGWRWKRLFKLPMNLERDWGREESLSFFMKRQRPQPERKDLPSIRKGEYEGLEEKLKDPKWKPDEGPDHFNPKSGATVVGARFPLVAYNVNLKTKDLALAKEIAKKVRFKDGGFPHVRAMGVDLKEKGMVQVSMNLTNYRVTNIPKVYEFIKEEALKKGVEIEESEIVGLIPLGVLEGIAQYYLQIPTVFDSPGH